MPRMYYMVYYESNHGCSSPPYIRYTDFDTLPEAQNFIEGLQQANDWRDDDYKRDGWSSRYENREIRLCIVLDEPSY